MRRKHTRKHRNPSRAKRVHHRRRARVHRNPTMFSKRRSSRKASSGTKDMLKEFLSMDGAFLIGGGVAGATLPTMALNRFAPNLTGYSRIAAKGALGLAGAWALAKFVNKKLGLGFGITALASAVSEAVNLVQLGAAIPTAPQTLQDTIAQNPGVMMVPPSGFSYLPSPFPLGPAQLADYGAGLGDYGAGLGDGWGGGWG
jgi:hypothetical protein